MIERDPKGASSLEYDLIVVGGGAYGVAVTLEAARRGLRPLLLERRDFGGATSWNSLRIVHGGLRYLQTIDLHRFKESIRERRWLLRNFPDQVMPLPCLMPLYGEGFRRPSVFRIALALNDLLSANRNQKVSSDRRIPGGCVISGGESERVFPLVDKNGLQGGAVWYDAAMPDSQRLLIEMLHWATCCGAVMLNYVEATELPVVGRRVEGVRARDATTGELFDFSAPVVVNCGGPWCREIAARFDRDVPELFHLSLAFNVLFDREPLSQAALAVRRAEPGARTYFLVPWKGRVLAGTVHETWTTTRDRGEVADELIDRFLDDLNQAIPGLDLLSTEILRVHWGFLPAQEEGSCDLARREVLIDHETRGGPAGLFSVSGVKFTTARLVAEKTLRTVLASQDRALPPLLQVVRPKPTGWLSVRRFETLLELNEADAAEHARDLVTQESVVELADLLLRRTDWGILPRQGEAIGSKLGRLLDRATTARAEQSSAGRSQEGSSGPRGGSRID